jgi:hypothetical protein
MSRTLILRALILGAIDRPKAACGLLIEAIDLTDPREEPDLAAIAIHNMAWFLVDDRRPLDALAILQDREAEAFPIPSRHKLRDQWLRARILAALGGGKEFAITELQAVLKEFRELNQPYDAALVGLELVLLQIPSPAAFGTLREIQAVFVLLGIEREALAAVLLKRAQDGQVVLARIIPQIGRALRGMPRPSRLSPAV